MLTLLSYISSSVFFERNTSSKKDNKIAKDIFLDILNKNDVHLQDKSTAHVLINDNNVVSMNDVKGLHVKVTELYKGVKLKIDVDDNTKYDKAIHLCIGKLSTSKEPLQRIYVDFTVGENCYVSVLAHCIFQSSKVIHKMEGTINVKKNSTFKYLEGHIHPEKGDVVVEPTVIVNLEKDSKFVGDFQILEGIAGKLTVRYDVDCKEKAIADLMIRVSAKGDDVVRIYENGYLNKPHARAILKSRVSARENANCEVRNTLIASAPYAKGHIDCHEILKDNGVVTAVPLIRATHHLASVTHEASLGRVNEKQLETLLSKGLTEDEATEVIIKGMLEM